MSGVDTRHLDRDSLFLMAEIRLDGTENSERLKVRNLSPGGMMAEGVMEIVAGTRLMVNLRNIGWIKGSVAWVQENRFGVAFDKEIDPKLPRQHVGNGDISTPRFVRSAGFETRSGHDGSRLRKI